MYNQAFSTGLYIFKPLNIRELSISRIIFSDNRALVIRIQIADGTYPDQESVMIGLKDGRKFLLPVKRVNHF